jgi:hypothetical protein
LERRYINIKIGPKKGKQKKRKEVEGEGTNKERKM